MLLKDNTVNHLADLFSALSDPTRLRIISALLEGELNVGDIAAQLEMTESAVSHQLRGHSVPGAVSGDPGAGDSVLVPRATGQSVLPARDRAA